MSAISLTVKPLLIIRCYEKDLTALVSFVRQKEGLINFMIVFEVSFYPVA